MQEFSLPITRDCNGIAITITKITVNKSFNCLKSDCFDSREKNCDYRKKLCLSPETKILKFVEIEIIIHNKSFNIDFELNRQNCQLIDNQHFSYNAGMICCTSITPRYEYFYEQEIKPNVKTRGILVFPELDVSLFISKLMLYGYISDTTHSASNCMFDFDFCKFDDETEGEYNNRLLGKNEEETKRDEKVITPTINSNSNSSSFEIGQIERGIARLNRCIFQRLNNILTKSDKIQLQNSIMNIEFNLKQEIQTLPKPHKSDFTTKIDNIISDYHLSLSNNNDVQTSIFEKISKQGVREDLGEVEFRSSWEANIARILNQNKIVWTYEKMPFEMGTICYLPDFFINDDTILEVKGFWDIDSINKVNAFIRNHSEYKTLIVDGDMYPTLNELYSITQPIAHWENTMAPQGQESNITIVGIAYCNKEVIEKLCVGEHLTLEREADNTYDNFAIAVKNKNGEPIGHLEKELAPIYTQKLELGMEFDVVITEKRQKILKAKIKRINWDKVILFDVFAPTNQNTTTKDTSKEKEYCVGDKVEHSKFGTGTVVEVNKRIVHVAFESFGVKEFSIALAPLKVIT